MSNNSNITKHSPLIRYLRVTDYEALELVYAEIKSPDHSELQFIEHIISEWKEEQAIANLLFYPELIPEPLRFDAILRALESDDAPYYVLAAVVGLQTIDHNDWTSAQRKAIGERLISITSQDVEVIAARASITVWEYLDDLGDDRLLKLYPVATATANKNIMAFALTRYADNTKKNFKKTLKAMNIKWGTRRKFVKRFKKYLRGKRTGNAVFMQAPQYIEIPSLADVDQRVVIQS